MQKESTRKKAKRTHFVFIDIQQDLKQRRDVVGELWIADVNVDVIEQRL